MGVIKLPSDVLLFPTRTTLTQTAKISVFGIPLIGSMLEGMLISSYGATVSQVITVIDL